MGFEKLDYKILDEKKMASKSEAFLKKMGTRRTVRDFSTKNVPITIVENCIKVAATAPSGANKQPWHFVIVKDKNIKKEIRKAAEKEEKEFYKSKASKEWLKALEPLGTNYSKPFLETAPYLICIFVKNYGLLTDGSRVKHYYATESVGIATGILITALHNAGLSTLTHTPSPMRFLNKIFKRPDNERPFLLLVTGFADKEAKIPDIKKLPLDKMISHRYKLEGVNEALDNLESNKMDRALLEMR